jgi:y4mF family transcriptional regulator
MNLFYNFDVDNRKSQYTGIMNNIGADIKARRKMLNVTQRTLSELADVGINTITKIERGEANPSLDVLEKLLDTLGLDIQIIVKGKQ